MQSPLSWLHRGLTLRLLRLLLNRTKTGCTAAPAPGRILYVAASCRPYHITGYTSRTHELLRALKESGADLRVVTRTGYPWDRRDRLCPPETEKTQLDGIAYNHFHNPGNNRFTAVYAAQASKVLEQYAREERVACIHAASNHVNALPALIAARRLGIPFQYEMRGLWELSRSSRIPSFKDSHNYRLGLELEGLVAAHADRVFVISEQLGRYAQNHWGIPQARLRLLPNCVDGRRIILNINAKADPDSIGYAGTFIAYEGLDTLIQAVGKLTREGRHISLHLVGDGEARQELVALTVKLGLEKVVRFHGRVSPEEARAHISRCALVCIPRKPFAVCEIVPPIKLAEALALEKPVVVPDLPVFRDELGSQPAGWFFRSGDACHLAEILASALSAPERLASLGKQGRKYILEHRQWQRFVGTVLSSESENACSPH